MFEYYIFHILWCNFVEHFNTDNERKNKDNDNYIRD